MTVIKSSSFDKWFKNLNDLKAKISVGRRIDKIQQSNHLGDYKHIDGDIY